MTISYRERGHQCPGDVSECFRDWVIESENKIDTRNLLNNATLFCAIAFAKWGKVNISE